MFYVTFTFLINFFLLLLKTLKLLDALLCLKVFYENNVFIRIRRN